MVMVSSSTTHSPLHFFAPLSEIPPKTFETERLTLRSVTLDDCELMFKTYTSDPLVTKYMSFPCASSPEDSRPFVTSAVANFEGQRSEHKQFSWLVFRKDTHECIGAVGLGINDAKTLGGGYLFTRSSWGQGFATEAWRPVIQWAMNQPNVQRIEAEHHPDNPSSGNVMRKLGLKVEGVHPNHTVLPNISKEKVDMVVWAWNRG